MLILFIPMDKEIGDMKMIIGNFIYNINIFFIKKKKKKKKKGILFKKTVISKIY